MTKMKVFKLVEENSEAITDFLATVNVTNEGFLISDGNLGIMYREQNDYGMDKNQKIIHITSEYSKAQKQFLIQEGLVRAHGGMVKLWTGKMEAKKAIVIEKQKALDTYNLTWRKDLEDKYNEVNSLSESLSKKHNFAPKNEKENILKEIFETNTTLRNIEPEFLEYQKGFKAGLDTLQNEINLLTIEATNFTAKIKQDTELQEQAVEDREHSEVFMKTTVAFIKDIQGE